MMAGDYVVGPINSKQDVEGPPMNIPQPPIGKEPSYHNMNRGLWKRPSMKKNVELFPHILIRRMHRMKINVIDSWIMFITLQYGLKLVDQI